MPTPPVNKYAPNNDFQLIIHTKNHSIPYSRGHLVDSLLSLGMKYEQAFSFAGTISEEFPFVFSSGVVSGKDFQAYIRKVLSSISPHWASRFRLFNSEKKSIYPFIILIGGTPGIGKSSLANRLARRLKATNLLGTDILREILRGIISPSLMPSLHFSSFESTRFLSDHLQTRMDPIIVGFEQQVTKVMVAIETVISHQLTHPDISVIEGVHLVPTLINSEILKNPRVIFMMLTLDNDQKHLSRLKHRAKKYPSRKTDRLIELFDNVRLINGYLIDRAKVADIPIIDCENSEAAVDKMMDIMWSKALLMDQSGNDDITTDNKKQEKE